MTDPGDVRWLDDDQQHSWRALMMGMTLLEEIFNLDAQLDAAGAD